MLKINLYHCMCTELFFCEHFVYRETAFFSYTYSLSKTLIMYSSVHFEKRLYLKNILTLWGKRDVKSQSELLFFVS